MLATLNLQFSPVEITPDPLTPSVAMPQGTPSGGFAALLRLRTDTVTIDGENPGELLPPGGTQLPLQALPVELEGLPELDAGDKPLPLGEPLLEIQATDPVLDLPLHHPLTPGADALASAADTAVTTVAPAVSVVDRATDAAGARDVSGVSTTTPLPQIADVAPRPGSVTYIRTANASISDIIAPPTPGPREHPSPPQPQVVPNQQLPLPRQPQALATLVPVDVDETLPRVELPRRAEPALPPVTSYENTSEIIKPRPTVTQPVQVLNAQPNPQQPIVTSVPAPPASVDTGYLAAAQQANDLIQTPVKHAAWGEQIGERVLLMAGNHTRTAEIRLTPAELGPLRVQVSVDDGAANVTFQAQHAVTREAIETALPRLRELLAENGLSLGQASVGEQGVDGYKRDEHTGSPRAGSDADDILDARGEGEATVSRSNVVTNSLVDTFA